MKHHHAANHPQHASEEWGLNLPGETNAGDACHQKCNSGDSYSSGQNGRSTLEKRRTVHSGPCEKIDPNTWLGKRMCKPYQGDAFAGPVYRTCKHPHQYPSGMVCHGVTSRVVKFVFIGYFCNERNFASKKLNPRCVPLLRLSACLSVRAWGGWKPDRMQPS